jgi:hypothetical protein
MSLDTRGRSAAQELLRSTRSDLEARPMLDTLHRTSDRRTGTRVAVAVALVAVLLGVVALSWSAWHPGGSTPPTVTTPTPSATAPSPTSPSATSLGLSEPATAVPPPGWTLTSTPDLAVVTSLDHYFVEVLVGPTPIGTSADPAPSLLTAQSLAAWVSTHSGIVPTTVVRTTIGGLPAFQVDLRQAAGAPKGTVCDPANRDCVPLVRLASHPLPFGVVGGTVGRAYILTLPSGRIAVVAAGAGGDDRIGALVNATQPVLDSLQFPAG